MEIFTDKKISPKGTVNKADLIKIGRDTAIFFAAPILLYCGQLGADLANKGVLSINDFIPSSGTIGALQGWALGIVVNFFLKLNDGKK